MLAKEKRLNLKKDFTWVASGQKTENDLLKLFFRFGNNNQPKVGIAVSSKTFKQAVERNRARRVVSFGMETFYGMLPASINIVAMPKATTLKIKSKELVVSLEALLKRSKILTDEKNNR